MAWSARVGEGGWGLLPDISDISTNGCEPDFIVADVVRDVPSNSLFSAPLLLLRVLDKL